MEFKLFVFAIFEYTTEYEYVCISQI